MGYYTTQAQPVETLKCTTRGHLLVPLLIAYQTQAQCGRKRKVYASSKRCKEVQKEELEILLKFTNLARPPPQHIPKPDYSTNDNIELAHPTCTGSRHKCNAQLQHAQGKTAAQQLSKCSYTMRAEKAKPNNASDTQPKLGLARMA